uniref:Ribosomal protein L2 n=1 Tax=Pleurocladia lacustris TaxID=246121 RepID=A0A1I9LW86_9PHAE|nr:ribosomal protein L2 [Pleurocladia lacustris]ANS57814.1 ribosomal protein L2 [Pleurocladia lacustris]ANS57856.1 ribosomal protein L2 [Pleurocladia lacustris]
MKQDKQIFIPNSLKSQTKYWNSSNGRNHKGHITAWHRGGGHARLYRIIDLKRKNTNGIVVGLEYDPNRSSFLARIFNPDTERNNYIIAPSNIKRGDIIRSNSKQNGFQNGHSKSLRQIMTGTLIHNLSLSPGEKGKILRAPGACGLILKRTKSLAKIRLKSGQYRWFNIKTMATNGVVGNTNSRFNKLRKAGQSRWIGRRPIVRGVAMNPIDHPHGGGEGKTSGGRPSVTPWGKPTKGQPTRRFRVQPKPNAKI